MKEARNPSSGVLYIFQLAAIMSLRIVFGGLNGRYGHVP